MEGRKSILFVSNGYGEDNVAAHVARELKDWYPGYTLRGFPTVGEGTFYTRFQIECAGTGVHMPSEGFVRSLRDFLFDVKHGLFRQTVKMGFHLRKVSRRHDVLVIVGDPYLLFFTSLFAHGQRKNRIFIGLQQSEWYGSRKPFKEHYSLIERWWLRWFASLIIARDTKTGDYLRTKGLSPAVSFGNPMMNCFSVEESRIFPQDRVVIGVLPGSKREAYENFKVVVEIARELKRLKGSGMNFVFAVALSPNLEMDALIKGSGLERWEDHNFFNNRGEGISAEEGGGVYKDRWLDIPFFISKEHFGTILSCSSAVIGISGTGNEQAAGMGKPVFAFWGRGPQITKKFLEAQKRLLGISLFISPPQPRFIAEKIHELLCDREEMEKIAINGRMRMGGKGSIRRIADEIHKAVGMME